MNSSVNSYFQFSSFNVDSNFMLFCHMHGSKAFSIHCVKLSSLTNKKDISTFSLQCFVHFLPRTGLVNIVVIFQKQKWFTRTIKIFMFFSVLNKKMNCTNNETFGRNNLVFPVKTNSFYWISQQEATKPKILVLYLQIDRQMLSSLNDFLGVFGYLIENKYILEHLKFVGV